MKGLTRLAPLAAAVWFLAASGGAAAPPPEAAGFVRTAGRKLVVGADKREIRLRGVAFAPSTVAEPREEDYADVARMGMNTVRLALRDRFFRDSAAPGGFKDPGWQLLDAHLAFARKHGIYLILQLCGIEGAQFVPDRDSPFDYRIWKDSALQENFVALWRAIAERYRDVPEIVGYSLFCEPVVSATLAQWQMLANRTIERIRQVDDRHIIFVERIYGENEVRREVSGKELPPEKAFFLAQDSNVVYEIYFFERDEYTHQGAPWRADLRREIAYPDPSMRILYEERPAGLKKTFRFDRNYLAFYLARQAKFGADHEVPMFVWAFGAIRSCFRQDGGGQRWLEDTMSLLEKNGFHWTAWTYRDENFGIRDNPDAREILSRAARGATAMVRESLQLSRVRFGGERSIPRGRPLTSQR